MVSFTSNSILLAASSALMLMLTPINAAPAPQAAGNATIPTPPSNSTTNSTANDIPPLLIGRSVTYTCLFQGLSFSDPSSVNKTAQITFVPGVEQGKKTDKCNAAFPSICNNSCTISTQKTAGFNCVLNGNIIKDSNNRPVLVNIWWGFDSGAATFACNSWVSACQNQCVPA